MRLKVQRKNYQIKFHHNFLGTECQITDLKGFIHGKGVTKLHPKDQLNRPVGRKYALARAIQNAFPVDYQNFTERKKARNKRKLFWQAYWEERKNLTGREFAA